MLCTGKERDAETGLDYFGARYFSAAQGRWTSPDWSETPQAVPYSDLTDPQSLNLYSYVRNNPLSKADPDGHCGLWPMTCTSVKQFVSSLPDRLVGGLKGEANAAMEMVGVSPKFQPSNPEQADAMAQVETVKPEFQTGLAVALGPRLGKRPVEAFEVGEYSTLKSRSVAGDELDIHHVGQQNPMKQLVENYDPKTAPAIALPEAVHENISTQRGPASTSPRGQLAKDARDLRNAGVPNQQVQKVIDLNKQKYPEMNK